jgi:alanine-synthesizing transaminase
VELDPETEVVTTIGAKEGLSHLMWVLVGPGDTALVPSPSYPIHIYAPLFAGADIRHVRLDTPAGDTVDTVEGGAAFFDNLMEAWESAWPKPRVVVLSFPHNPTTECVDLAWMTRIVEFAKEHDIVLVHDFAYADIAFDGYTPPSILQVPGAKDCCVELYTLTKSFSMAGWRVGFLVGNAEIVQALTKLKSYLDYGTFQPIQIAAIVAMNEVPDYPKLINDIYQSRRDALCDGLNRIGWEVTPPRGTMFVWAPIPEPYREMGSLEFAKYLVREADVATSPGVGFGPGGDGHVRFALIENEQRVGQGIRSLRKALTRLQ